MDQNRQKFVEPKGQAANEILDVTGGGTSTPEQIRQLSLEMIVALPQLRIVADDEQLEGLIASITAVGLLQPIRVRPVGSKFVIVDGERRFRAMYKMGRKTIATIVELNALSDAEVLQKQLISNCQRENLTPLERAVAISRLISLTGWTAGETAAKLGMSSSTATRLLALLTLPQAIQDRIAARDISANAGYQLSLVSDPARQAELARQAGDGELNRDALIAERKKVPHVEKRKSSQSTNRVTAILGDGRSISVAAPTLDLELFIECLESLLAKARQVRTKGIELKTFISMLKDQNNQDLVG